MGEKNSFILYTDYWRHIELLDRAQRGDLITAIFTYVQTGALPLFDSDASMMAFSFIRAQLDRDAEKWEEERRKRSEAGKRGADARWNPPNLE